MLATVVIMLTSLFFGLWSLAYTILRVMEHDKVYFFYLSVSTICIFIFVFYACCIS